MGNLFIVLMSIVPLMAVLDLPALRQHAPTKERVIYGMLTLLGLTLLVVAQIFESVLNPLPYVTQMLMGTGEWILRWHANI